MASIIAHHAVRLQRFSPKHEETYTTYTEFSPMKNSKSSTLIPYIASHQKPDIACSAYYHRGQKHEVWFENVKSLEAELQTVSRNNIGGISLWRLGGEDPNVFPLLAQYKKQSSARIRSDTLN